MFKKLKLRDLLFSALFSALISVLAYVSIPLPFSPVPITGQTFGVMLAGLLLSPLQAFMSVLTFLLLGAVGVPVFSQGRAGIGVLVGPSGGYLLGFLIGAVVISILCRNKNNILRMAVSAIIGGIIVVYLLGVPWLGYTTGMGIKEAVMGGALFYLPGDLIKVIVSVILAKKINAHMQFGR